MKSRKRSTSVVKASSNHVTICKIGLRFESLIVILFDLEPIEPPWDILVVDGIVKNRWGPKPFAQEPHRSTIPQRDVFL